MAKKKYPKRPKAPKKTASVLSHQRYHERMKEWEKRCKEVDKENSAQIAAAKKTEALKRKR